MAHIANVKEKKRKEMIAKGFTYKLHPVAPSARGTRKHRMNNKKLTKARLTKPYGQRVNCYYSKGNLLNIAKTTVSRFLYNNQKTAAGLSEGMVNKEISRIISTLWYSRKRIRPTIS